MSYPSRAQCLAMLNSPRGVSTERWGQGEFFTILKINKTSAVFPRPQVFSKYLLCSGDCTTSQKANCSRRRVTSLLWSWPVAPGAPASNKWFRRPLNWPLEPRAAPIAPIQHESSFFFVTMFTSAGRLESLLLSYAGSHVKLVTECWNSRGMSL